MILMLAMVPTFVTTYFTTNAPEAIAGHAVLIFGSIAIMWTILWGFKEVWVYYKQGKYWVNLKWNLFEVSVPQDAVQTPKGMVNFFTHLAGSKSSITFKEGFLDGKFQAYFGLEIVSNGGDIKMYIRLQQKYIDLVQAALYAQYPEAQIVEVDDYVDIAPTEFPNEEYDLFGSEIVSRKADYMPFRTYDVFEHQGEKDQRFKDPMLGLFEMLGKMRPGEHYWIQTLIMQPDEQDWRKEGVKAINELYGKKDKPKKSWFGSTFGWLIEGTLKETLGIEIGGSEAEDSPDDFRMFKITPDEREMLDAVQRKISFLGWYSTIRFVYFAKKDVFRKGTVAAMTKGYFHQFSHPGWNKLGIHGPSTTKDDYFWQEWQLNAKQKRILGRYKSRSFTGGSTPFIFNCEELATMFHFPAADARTPVLTQVTSRLAEAPLDLQFSPEDAPDLPDIGQGAGPPGKKVAPVDVSTPLVVPSPPTPTTVGARSSSLAGPAQDFVEPISSAEEPSLGEEMPQPGMPAPLPPGLDLRDEPIEHSESPTDLPL